MPPGKLILSKINLSSRMDTPPSGGRTRTYATADAEGHGGDTPGQRSGVSLILSHNGASGDTPESSGMIPKRSTSGAAQGDTVVRLRPEVRYFMLMYSGTKRSLQGSL